MNDCINILVFIIFAGSHNRTSGYEVSEKKANVGGLASLYLATIS